MNLQSAMLALSVTLLAAPLPGAALLQEQTGSFMLSVLRRDGIVVPFAAFNGRRWAGRWPDRVPLERPISLDDIPDAWWGVEPAPRRMHHWSDGVRVGDVTVTAPIVTSLMCAPRMALRSDYKPLLAAPPRFVLPFPKDGLLVSGDVTVSKIDTLDPASAEGADVLALAIDEFNRQESAAASAFTAWRHPVKPAARKKMPATLEALYRAPTEDPELTAYFIEAVRQYPPGPAEKDGCGLATYVSGWVVTGPNGRATVRIGAHVTFCDRKGVAYMLPFGLVRADGKNYWVFQYSGFEMESYEVIRPHRGGVVNAVVYRAGACAR